MDVQGITINRSGDRARDFAVWADQDARGWLLTFCISNIADAISKDSIFDKTAHRRVQTQYHDGGRSAPLLPRRFSEGSCSITPGHSRAVIAVRIRLGHELERQFISIDVSDLSSAGCLSWMDVPGILRDKNCKLFPVVDRINRIASTLSRIRRGLNFVAQQDFFEEVDIKEVGGQERDGFLITRELAIFANSELAGFCIKNDLPVPYRNQVMARRPSYEHVCEGHSGLRLTSYLHGMSPSSRYADLVVQRQVLAHINGTEPPYSIEDIRDISKHLNVSLENRERAEAQSHLERASRRKIRSVPGGSLADLPDNEFERILKNYIKSKSFNEKIAKAVEDRINSDRITIPELYTVLLKADIDIWRDLIRVALGYIVRNPCLGIPIVSMAARRSGWGDPIYEIQRKGSGGALLHEVRVKFKRINTRYEFVSAKTLKLAKRRASVEVISNYLGEPRPDWEYSDRSNGGLSKSWQQPINALAEYCQSIGRDLPCYRIRNVKSDGSQLFIANCQALDLVIESDPKPSKRLAKRQAARTVIDLIHAKNTQQGNIYEKL